MKSLTGILICMCTALLLVACGAEPTATPAPTAAPSLDANFWMDYPAVRAGQAQSANLVVLDPNGQPVAGATAVLIVRCGNYRQEYRFTLTDADGRARVAVEVPASAADKVVTATVTVIDSATNQWARSETQFEVLKATQ